MTQNRTRPQGRGALTAAPAAGHDAPTDQKARVGRTRCDGPDPPAPPASRWPRHRGAQPAFNQGRGSWKSALRSETRAAGTDAPSSATRPAWRRVHRSRTAGHRPGACPGRAALVGIDGPVGQLVLRRPEECECRPRHQQDLDPCHPPTVLTEGGGGRRSAEHRHERVRRATRPHDAHRLPEPQQKRRRPDGRLQPPPRPCQGESDPAIADHAGP